MIIITCNIGRYANHNIKANPNKTTKTLRSVKDYEGCINTTGQRNYGTL